MNLKQKVSAAFQEKFNEPPTYIVRAPGRVNLIGEHTDYNDGFVLPMAIDRAIWIALRPRSDRRVFLRSLDFKQPADFSLVNFSHKNDWTEYVRGIAWILQKHGFPISGWEGVLIGDVPLGAGLSSSAALELSLLKAFWTVSDFNWEGAQMANFACQADQNWVGVQSGVMDQMISALGKEHHALLIDCRTLDFNLLPLPEDTRVIVLDTATRRGLVNSAYNERVAQCRAAAKQLGIPSLRDISLDDFNAKANSLAPTLRKRARHVISENERTLQAAKTLKQGNLRSFGQLMNASHNSLRDDYEVSSRELNTIVEIAQAQSGCFGARMTGAGFGGCAVALVQKETATAFVENIRTRYRANTGVKPNIYICEASNGAETLA